VRVLKILPLLIFGLSLSYETVEAKTNACSQKLSGTWEFGQAPYGCAISADISQPLQSKYPSLVYDEKQDKSEAFRFTNEMYNYLIDYSTAYFKRRSPNASDAEIDQWNHLVLSVVHQESYWTQYRKGKDGLFRFFRGDGGHGYGMMQIDDRWHKEVIRNKKVYDIGSHFIYALDILYSGRTTAKKKPCGSKRDIASIDRSTYAIYNGGSRARCRWQNSASKWSKNDKNFLEKYTNRSWEKVIVAGRQPNSQVAGK
jgi:hypothetical protein